VGRPIFSTNRKIREDYFGLGAANSSFFSIPIGLLSNVVEGSGFGIISQTSVTSRQIQLSLKLYY
jgi:hypothetical protein